jgi:hypothetical protein
MGLLERNLRLADRVPDPFPSADSKRKKRTISLVSVVVHSALIYISFATIFMEYQASRDDKSGGYDESNLLIQPPEKHHRDIVEVFICIPRVELIRFPIHFK